MPRQIAIKELNPRLVEKAEKGFPVWSKQHGEFIKREKAKLRIVTRHFDPTGGANTSPWQYVLMRNWSPSNWGILATTPFRNAEEWNERNPVEDIENIFETEYANRVKMENIIATRQQRDAA